MAILEAQFTWTFSGSTAAVKARNIRGGAQSLTFGYETSSGCTGTVALMHRMGSSAGPYTALSSQALAAGEFMTDQFLGPLEWVKPRLVTLTAGSTNTFTVYLLGN